MHYVLSSFAIILTRKRELVALILSSFGCLATVNVLWLFLTVLLVGLQCVIVVFSDHCCLLFNGSMRLYSTYLNYHGFQANRINEVVYFVDLRTDIFYIMLHGEKPSTEMEKRGMR